jgi:hypothetical protein
VAWTEALAILTTLQYCVRVALSVLADVMHLTTHEGDGRHGCSEYGGLAWESAPHPHQAQYQSGQSTSSTMRQYVAQKWRTMDITGQSRHPQPRCKKALTPLSSTRL